MKTATLKPILIESWQPSKKSFIWVKAYTITTPEGKELAPPMRATTSHYEISAREFCKEQGWKVIIQK